MQRRLFVQLCTLSAPAVSCSKPESFSCESVDELDEPARQMRTRLGYLEKSPEPKRRCSVCSQFLPSARCGSCKVMPGPAHPNGTCNVFSPG